MNFSVPYVIECIEDINKIYQVNDKTYADLTEALENFKLDIFPETMSIEMIERYEEMLDILPLPKETIEQRRMNIIMTILNQYPYSLKALIKRLNTLLGTKNGEYYTLDVDVDNEIANLRIGLEIKKYYTSAFNLVDEIIPMNIQINEYLDYNTYGRVKNFSFGDLETGVHDEGTGFTFGDMYDTALHLYITALE